VCYDLWTVSTHTHARARYNILYTIAGTATDRWRSWSSWNAYSHIKFTIPFNTRQSFQNENYSFQQCRYLVVFTFCISSNGRTKFHYHFGRLKMRATAFHTSAKSSWVGVPVGLTQVRVHLSISDEYNGEVQTAEGGSQFLFHCSTRAKRENAGILPGLFIAVFDDGCSGMHDHFFGRQYRYGRARWNRAAANECFTRARSAR